MLNDYIKTLPQWFIPKHALTCFAGLMANIEYSPIKNKLIAYFIRKYKVNLSEAIEENPQNYKSFNSFFIRHLKAECRPIAAASIVSPVDGTISELGSIDKGSLLQAKGRYYSVIDLLAGNTQLSEQFTTGKFATFYLAPKDYHRIHMPVDATLRQLIYIPGKLFSVQPTTARVIPYLFARNERVVAFFDTHLGLMAMVLVGATIVGAIGTKWHGDIQRSTKVKHFNYASANNPELSIQQGAEMGYFKLGSTVVLLFANGENFPWKNNLLPGSTIRYGEALSEK